MQKAIVILGNQFTSFDDLESGVRRTLPRVLFEASPQVEVMMMFAYLIGPACTLLPSDPAHRTIQPMKEADITRLVVFQLNNVFN